MMMSAAQAVMCVSAEMLVFLSGVWRKPMMGAPSFHVSGRQIATHECAFSKQALLAVTLDPLYLASRRRMILSP